MVPRNNIKSRMKEWNWTTTKKERKRRRKEKKKTKYRKKTKQGRTHERIAKKKSDWTDALVGRGEGSARRVGVASSPKRWDKQTNKQTNKANWWRGKEKQAKQHCVGHGLGTALASRLPTSAMSCLCLVLFELALQRGTIVNRTYGIHKHLHV